MRADGSLVARNHAGDHRGSIHKVGAALVPVVKAARPDHDLVIVVLHWGEEYKDEPARWQVKAARAYIDAVPADRVVQYHLAGHTNKGTHIIDTHSGPALDTVWALYARACARSRRRAERFRHARRVRDATAGGSDASRRSAPDVGGAARR